MNIPASPFERANKLRESRSSPSTGSKAWAVPKAPKAAAEDDDFRFFQSPEAVKGFTLHAYRPGSLPLVQTGEFIDEGHALELPIATAESGALHSQFDAVDALEWPESDIGAVSITGSPRLLRTDVPLTRFQPPRDCATLRRVSLDADMQSVARARLELVARSASAPAVFESLHVQELWKGVQPLPTYNPFANTPDTDGVFGVAA